MSNQRKRSSSTRIGNSDKRHRKNGDDNYVVYISNLAEPVDVQRLEDFLIDRFGLAYKKDLEIDLCIVRNRFNDAVVKCTNEIDVGRLLRLKSRILLGNTMEFVQWSSQCGDIDDFFNGVPSTRRTRERCHFKRRCEFLQRGPEECKYFHTREEIAHYHPYYYGDGDGDGGTDVREEVPEGNYVLHITNVIGAVDDQHFSRFLLGKIKAVFKHDLKIVRCRVRQNFNDAIIECGNEYDCSLLLMLKSRKFKKHMIEIARLPSSIHDVDDNDNDAINTTDTWISIDQNQAVKSVDTASQNTTKIVNSIDTKIAEDSDDKSAMLLIDEEPPKLLNEDTMTSQNNTEIEHIPDITTDISNDKHEMLLIDEGPQKLQNEDAMTSQDTTEIEYAPDTTADISNGKQEVILGNNEENQKLQNEDTMTSQDTTEIEHTPDTTADILNGKNEVILGNDEENTKLQNEDMTNRKTSIDNTPDTTEKVSNDKYAIILGEYETLKLQHEVVIKQKFELSLESEDLKVKHEDTLSRYTKLKKFLSHSKVDQANLVSLKREIVESNQRIKELTDTLLKQSGTISDVMEEKRNVMEEKRDVVSRLEKMEQAFDGKKSELRKQLDARLESEVSIRQEAERVFGCEKSELRKQLENAQRDSDREISELRKQIQDEKCDSIKRLQREASLRKEVEKKLQDKEHNFDKERSHHEQETSELKEQFKDEMRGHRDEKQAFLQEESSFHKQLDTEISRRQEAEELFHKEKSVLRQELDAEISRRQKAEKDFHQEKSELRNQLDKETRKRKQEEERNDQLMTTYGQLKKEREEAPTNGCSTRVKEEETS